MGGAKHLLVFNAGSSSLKAEIFGADDCRSRLRVVVEDVGWERSRVRLSGGESEQLTGIPDHRAAAELVLERLADALETTIDATTIAATGHRIVHGGEAFSAPVVVTDAVLGQLESVAELAPLHNPPALGVMRLVERRLTGVPMVAVFDTAFFRDLPEHARVYAIPDAWQRFGIRRYGFHGIAHEYLHGRYRALRARKPRPERVLSLQLGHGCSIAAILDGRAVETSMGYTPLEGLIMATRPGDLDAGVLLQLARDGRSWQALENELNHEAGLLGLSGTSDDVRDLLAHEAHDARAALALAAFCHRIRKYLGAYAAVLGGVDAVLFGGGIGENAPQIRERISTGLEWLGLELDTRANAECVGAQRLISKPTSAIEAYVIPVREEEAIARAASACLAAPA